MTREEFEQAWTKHYGLALRVARHYSTEPEDVVQDAGLKLFRHCEKYTAENFEPLVMVVIRNAAASVRAKQASTLKTLAAYTAIKKLNPSDGRLLSADPLALDLLLRLPPIPQRIVHMVDYLGYSICEVADALGIKYDNCYEKLRRARAKLKKFATGTKYATIH